MVRKMLSKIKNAYKDQNLICIEQENDIDHWLIGRILYFDSAGLILYNVDYRGIGTGYIYICFDNIIHIHFQSGYLEKITRLWEIKKQKDIDLVLEDIDNLKIAFLYWISQKSKVLEIMFDDEHITGKIQEIQKGFLHLEILEKFSGETNGWILIILVLILLILPSDNNR